MAKKTADKPKAEKPATGKPAGPESVTVTYDLFELPTAQHKAGLAGLLMQIESMKNRKKLVPAWEYDKEAPGSKVHVIFTKETMESLFDDLYDATWTEGPIREKPFTKGKGAAKQVLPSIRDVTITKTDKKGKETTVPGYVYLELTPALATLRHYLPEQGNWVQLWRDLIWQVIRDSKKKAPYIQRAAGKSAPSGAAVADVEVTDESDDDSSGKGDGATWDDIRKHHDALKKNFFALGKLSSALLLGAQSVNAEGIAFSGRIDQNLLLHFWPMTTMVYVPQFIDGEGVSHIGRRNKEDKSQHFSVAIPEVTNLKGFLADYPRVLGALTKELAVYRPKEALVDLPAEGGISFVEHLARLLGKTATESESQYSVAGVDYLHLNKDGNIVRFLGTGRVPFSTELVSKYYAVAGRPGEKPPFANSLFRRALLVALLDNQPWYRPFGPLFAQWDVKFFVPTDDPPKLSWFWADARKKFHEVMQAMPEAPHPDDPPSDDDLLALTVRRVVNHYLDERLKKDAGYDFAKFREAKSTPPDAAEARRKLAERLFLEFRSRRDQAFVSHFTATFFSVGQFLGRGRYALAFERVADALMTRTEDVKTLTLMALSATSWVPAKKKEGAK